MTQPDNDVPTGTYSELAVTEILLAGEGQHVEFKSSLRWDYNEKRINKDLAKALPKTIAGFFNSKGGQLFIGVSDEAAILGVDNDIGTLSRKTDDAYERFIRTILAKHIGPEVVPQVEVEIFQYAGQKLVAVKCTPIGEPIFFEDGERREFYVRDGNRTVPLDIRAAHNYIRQHWAPQPGPSPAELAEVLQRVQDQLDARDKMQLSRGGTPWLKVAPRRVLNLFLSTLSRTERWQQLYIISPWVSEFGREATVSFDQLLDRFVKDRTTVYVVTRPPVEPWHKAAVERIAQTGRANIAFVPDLHVKLYTARTVNSDFAMIGSANFTSKSLENREIGMLVRSHADGRGIFDRLNREAAEIYRTKGRVLAVKAQL